MTQAARPAVSRPSVLSLNVRPAFTLPLVVRLTTSPEAPPLKARPRTSTADPVAAVTVLPLAALIAGWWPDTAASMVVPFTTRATCWPSRCWPDLSVIPAS